MTTSRQLALTARAHGCREDHLPDMLNRRLANDCGGAHGKNHDTVDTLFRKRLVAKCSCAGTDQTCDLYTC